METSHVITWPGSCRVTSAGSHCEVLRAHRAQAAGTWSSESHVGGLGLQMFSFPLFPFCSQPTGAPAGTVPDGGSTALRGGRPVPPLGTLPLHPCGYPSEQSRVLYLAFEAVGPGEVTWPQGSQGVVSPGIRIRTQRRVIQAPERGRWNG